MRAAASLAEEIVLLSLDDDTGRPVGRSGMAPDLALAGALLMDLALAGRVDTDRDRIWVADNTPTWDAVADRVLAELDTPDAPGDARGAIMLLARGAPAAREALLARLVEAGVLHRQEGRVLWVFPDRRYPKAAGREAAEDARARLRRLLLAEEIPEPRDALLLGLARAAGLLPLLFSAEELPRIQDWLNVVTRIESLNRSLGTAVAEVRAARSPSG
ncbi:GPP34 family phosphoprotein [Falsiroseomonas bella]|uniref:GPP34 family phosphoprotein n=1 Tax=Falsiroseomonas bella TaxID=2184016 RepID=A0A317FFZ0_9PROT|nr:GPP34 family phosphoprotein [Falsiroseomonas bella]PWS37483.1 GPP34 family phosphoprotein [Falsiroseomonas bella]